MPAITSYSLAGVGGAYLLATIVYLAIHFKGHSCKLPISDKNPGDRLEGVTLVPQEPEESH